LSNKDRRGTRATAWRVSRNRRNSRRPQGFREQHHRT